jgi:hypothetical protein
MLTPERLQRLKQFLVYRCNITRYMSNSTLGLEGSMSRSLFLKIEKWFLDDNSSFQDTGQV